MIRTRSATPSSALNAVVGDVRSFVADNRETLGTTSDKLASVSRRLTASLDDIKQTLHLAPNELQNLMNIYQPAQGTLGGAYAFNNFAEPGRVPVRRHPGGVAPGGRTVGQALRPVPGADRQEPPVQLPAAGREPRRRRRGAAERGDLQRGLDAARLRRRQLQRIRTAVPDDPPLPAEAHATDPADGLPGMMVPAGGGP